MLGCKGGSCDERCEYCDGKFSDLESLWSYAKIRQYSVKTLQTIFSQFASTNGIPTAFKTISPLIGDDVSIVKELGTLPELFVEFISGIDALHMGKGHISTLVERLRTWKSNKDKRKKWNDDLFITNAHTHVKRRLVSDYDGKHYRLLVIKWRQVILPSLPADELMNKTVSDIFHEWSEVSIIHFF